MRLLVDELFPKEVAERLRWRGYDVESVQERPDLAGRPDDEIFLFHVASGERRVLVTGNPEQFTSLAARAAQEGIDHAGVVLVATDRLPHGRAVGDHLVEALAELLRRQTDASLENGVWWLP